MKKKIFVLAFVLVLISTIVFVLNNKTFLNQTTTEQKNIFEDKTVKLYDENDCEIKKEDFDVRGYSMRPLIQDWQTVKVQLNYYNCKKNIPKWGDIVVFEMPVNLERVIKKLSIVPWDKIEIDKKTRTIKINWKTFVNSAKMEYVFSEHELKWFDIYTENWIISDNTYFIFWDNIHGSIDSRSYGPISLHWIVGKVDL